MTCIEALPLIGAHVDHELDLRASLDLEEHMRGCAGCRAESVELHHLKDVARARLARFDPSPVFVDELRRSLRPSATRRRLAWLGAGGAAAAAALAVFLIVWPAGGAGRARVRAEVLDAHARSLLADHLTDVQSSDKHTVKPWFHGKVGFGVPAEDFSAAGFPLVGGRLDYVEGQPVAALVYHRRNHDVNVFIWPAGAASVAEPVEDSQRGYAVMHWSTGGLTYWLVSDAALADLRELHDLLARRP